MIHAQATALPTACPWLLGVPDFEEAMHSVSSDRVIARDSLVAAKVFSVVGRM